jgi:hypothetical protein
MRPVTPKQVKLGEPSKNWYIASGALKENYIKARLVE